MNEMLSMRIVNVAERRSGAARNDEVRRRIDLVVVMMGTTVSLRMVVVVLESDVQLVRLGPTRVHLVECVL